MISKVFYISDLKGNSGNGCVGNVKKLLDDNELSKLFDDNIEEFKSFQEFFTRIYNDRVNDSIETNFENGVYLIIVNNAESVNIRQFNSTIRSFFPTLNLLAFNYSEFIGFTSDIALWQQLKDDIKVVNNKIKRAKYWMYHTDGFKNSEHTNCSSNIYSMWSHFNSVDASHKRISGNGNATHIPEYLRSIDFKKIITSRLKYTDDEEKYISIVSNWSFAINELNSSELIYCSYLIIKLSINQLMQNTVKINENDIFLFLFSIEASYHKVNKFHNFKHAVDVMQATWKLSQYLLPNDKKYSLTVLLLCFAAIGHDMAHPGTNNNIFIKYNTELSSYYNNESILENFHLFLFNNLLNEQRNCILPITDNNNVIKEAIMATDMAKHKHYVKKLDNLVITENAQVDLSEPQLHDMISFIIKAADISNVTRPLRISAQWAYLISLEFKECELLENYINNGKDDIIDKLSNDADDNIMIRENLVLSTDQLIKRNPHLSKSQIFFIDVFAEEFFNKLTKKFPILSFLTDNIVFNKNYWLKHSDEVND
ncbi:hypothetical protein TPHA_0H02950 [Tetrapisispora phaffii CBS 4417]|uniref:Phosphodiesterase n=1 Tax=Tetrapisispora phaffii (strain ATCC 24235 / CBS 4417 / NBRC 1672 / NRRL Y-8282 / UCD 70-5) TaxID=1071381 RepID=G8BWP7_TETPH|nr:hypothetical protein TPHA_0H02950 [Tetrapisispora phaffii CBS 4417]CCE64498.1 hypothetical protein TPHA_0H02950 [Tetrapisispora phaffii CBS 4417]